MRDNWINFHKNIEKIANPHLEKDDEWVISGINKQKFSWCQLQIQTVYIWCKKNSTW